MTNSNVKNVDKIAIVALKRMSVTNVSIIHLENYLYVHA